MRFFAVILLFFLWIPGHAGELLEDARKKGVLCEDGRTPCQYWEQDYSVLSKSGVGSYIVRTSSTDSRRIVIVYLGEDKHLHLLDERYHGLNYDPNQKQRTKIDTLKDSFPILKKPLQSSLFCQDKRSPEYHAVCDVISMSNKIELGLQPRNFLSCQENKVDSRFNRPLYCYGEPVFNGKSLVSFGDAISEEEAEIATEEVLGKTGLRREQLRGAQLFHGSNSAALLAFTDYSHNKGDLLPVGLIEKNKKVPFSGEIMFGRKGINAEALSTVWISGFEIGLQYAGLNKTVSSADSSSFSSEEIHLPASKKGHFLSKTSEFIKRKLPNWLKRENVFERNMREVGAKREKQWKTLKPYEQELVKLKFPVLFGIRSNREKSAIGVQSDISSEMGLRGGAQANEVKVLFVPADRVEYTRKLLLEHGHSQIPVEAFPTETLSNY